MARNLTIGQIDLVCTLRNFRHLNGYSPSIRELAAELHVSRRTIMQRVKALAARDIIRRAPGKARALEIIPQAA